MLAKLAYKAQAWSRNWGGAAKPDDERSPSEVDRSRILHSAAFRRLAGKTQIFGIAQDSFFRSRLTHSLEVAQIAKGIALRVGADVETCEAAALAHDIGHPPFGHRGEVVLAELMGAFGGFEANAQNFRILCHLEAKFIDEQGLDLTRTVLDSILKYRAPFDGAVRKFYYIDDARVRAIVEWAKEGYDDKSFECQIMDWADDVAYSCHDLEDGLHSGLITSQRLRAFGEEVLKRAQREVPDCDETDLEAVLAIVVRCENAATPQAYEATRKGQISALINEFVNVGRSRRAAASDDTPTRHQWDVTISSGQRRKCETLKSAAFVLLVSDPRVASLEVRADHVLRSLFELYTKPSSLSLYPEPFRGRFRDEDDDAGRARVACDFIAGMTDEYAERVYSRVFSASRAALADY